MSKTEQPQSADADKYYLELLKAVAQAWHAQAGNPKLTNEFDAEKDRSRFKLRPTRFKMEAISMASRDQYSSAPSSHWDFSESLLDSYEIVTLAKTLEANLALEHPVSGRVRTRKRSAESQNSLRNLFYKIVF